MEKLDFLTKKYGDLPGSKPVERAIHEAKRKGEGAPSDRAGRVNAYLDRLEALFTTPMGYGKERGDKGGLDLLKHKLLDIYVTKLDEVPESYWKSQEEEMRRRGEGGDWDSANVQQKENVKRTNAEAVLDDQRASLEEWIDYFALPDSKDIPRELKYWVFRSILGLQEMVKKKEGEREYIDFPKRSRGTMMPFPDLNQEPLGYVVDALEKKLAGKKIEFEHDIQPEEREDLEKFLEKEDFAKLYAWANELMNPIPEHLLPVTEGRWVKYEQGSDPHALVDTIRGKGTGWCTAGLNTAKK